MILHMFLFSNQENFPFIAMEGLDFTMFCNQPPGGAHPLWLQFVASSLVFSYDTSWWTLRTLKK